jgi:uncharacterized protein YkwD
MYLKIVYLTIMAAISAHSPKYIVEEILPTSDSQPCAIDLDKVYIVREILPESGSEASNNESTQNPENPDEIPYTQMPAPLQPEVIPPAPAESIPPAPAESIPPAPAESIPPAPEESIPPAPEESIPPAPKSAPKDSGPKNSATKNSGPKKSASKDKTLNEFELDCFNQHNHYRRSLVTTKGEPVVELKWRKHLAEKAQIWADKLVQNSIASYGGIGLNHSTEMNWGFGENLYSTKNGNQTCACATDAWFNEWPLYKNETLPDGDFSGYGHYTQLAWPETKYIGCAYGMNGNNIRFTVCEYDPPGNMVGKKLDVLVKGKQVK